MEVGERKAHIFHVFATLVSEVLCKRVWAKYFDKLCTLPGEHHAEELCNLQAALHTPSFSSHGATEPT